MQAYLIAPTLGGQWGREKCISFCDISICTHFKALPVLCSPQWALYFPFPQRPPLPEASPVWSAAFPDGWSAAPTSQRGVTHISSCCWSEDIADFYKNVTPNHHPHKSHIILPSRSRWVKSSPANLSDVLIRALAPAAHRWEPFKILRSPTCNSNCTWSIHQVQQEAISSSGLLTSPSFCEFWVKGLKGPSWQWLLWGQPRPWGPLQCALELHPHGSHHNTIKVSNLC